jgi:hypothetical protein
MMAFPVQQRYHTSRLTFATPKFDSRSQIKPLQRRRILCCGEAQEDNLMNKTVVTVGEALFGKYSSLVNFLNRASLGPKP